MRDRHGLTHALCDDCWDLQEPANPSTRSETGFPERCCRCGEPTFSGIYVRAELDEMPRCPDREVVDV